MRSARVEDSPAIGRHRQNITLWQEGDISHLSARAKKQYRKRKSALEAYFTTHASLDEIAQRYSLTEETLRKWAEKCLMLHEDGQFWGFRALLPGVRVVDYIPHPVDEQAAETISLNSEETGAEQDQVPTVEDIAVPATEGTSVSVEIAEDPLPAAPEDETHPEVSAAEAEPELEVAVEEPEEALREPAAEETEATEATEGIQVELAAEGTEGAEVVQVESAAEEMGLEHTVMAEIEARARAVTDPDIGVIVSPVTEVGTMPAQGSLVLPEAKKTAAIRRVGEPNHVVRKRWVRATKQHKRKRLQRIVALSIVALLLVMVVLPVTFGLAAYGAYSNIRGVAMDGVDHLLKVKTLLAVSKSDPMAALNATKLEQAQVEFTGAESDFTQLQQLVNRPDLQAAINQFSPNYGNELDMAQRLVRVGLDVSRMGNEVSSVALIGANIVHGSPLASGSNKPLITTSDVSAVEGALVHALYYIDDIQTQMSQVSLQELPVSTAQKAELASVMTLLPKARSYIVQAQSMVGLVSWLLGVGSPRRFLVQTLDSAELRPSGGFAGQYGILQIQDGRVAPFTLRDVALLDYAGNGNELGNSAPQQYRSWMNFGYFGLRDSNLSGDYPATARLNMQIFQDEGGGPVDGNIELTPAVISHVLEVTGPIKVAQYNETITAQNLEQKLHYYQQDFSAIAVEKQKTGSNSNEVRKAFTSLLGKLLMDKARQLPVPKLLTVAKYMLQDIKSRDLQIYFTNPAAESWLVQNGLSGGMSSFSQQDGFMVVQANISISKASQYVHTTEHDAITLDASGGATHVLTITLNYQQTGPVYGYDTYADYIRVYAPSNAQFLWGDGFDTGHALCTPSVSGGKGTGGTGGTDTGSGPGSGTGKTSGCAQYNTSFPSDARYCPNGDYQLGQRGFNVAWPVDSLGAPTAMTSDLPGHAMWGGLTETPKNCISTITVSWYVPHAVKPASGQSSQSSQSPYSLLVQKQGGYIPTVQIAIDTSAIKGLKPYTYSGNLTADKLFSLSVQKK